MQNFCFQSGEGRATSQVGNISKQAHPHASPAGLGVGTDNCHPEDALSLINGLSQDVQDDERPEDSVCDLCIFVGDSKCFINIFWTNKWKLRSCSRHRGLARCIHKELVMFS